MNSLIYEIVYVCMVHFADKPDSDTNLIGVFTDLTSAIITAKEFALSDESGEGCFFVDAVRMNQEVLTHKTFESLITKSKFWCYREHIDPTFKKGE